MVKLQQLSKELGYDGQGIRPEFSGHERLFERLNDSIKEVIESVGGKSYRKNHIYMKGNPKKKQVTHYGKIQKKTSRD